jgi:hypothetical protein
VFLHVLNWHANCHERVDDFLLQEITMNRSTNIHHRPGKIGLQTLLIYGVMMLLGVPGLIMLVLFLFGFGR